LESGTDTLEIVDRLLAALKKVRLRIYMYLGVEMVRSGYMVAEAAADDDENGGVPEQPGDRVVCPRDRAGRYRSPHPRLGSFSPLVTGTMKGAKYIFVLSY